MNMYSCVFYYISVQKPLGDGRTVGIAENYGGTVLSKPVTHSQCDVLGQNISSNAEFPAEGKLFFYQLNHLLFEQI